MKFHIKPFADNLNEYPWSFNLFQQGIHLLNRTSYIKIRILPQLSLDLNKGYFICFGIYAHQIYGFKFVIEALAFNTFHPCCINFTETICSPMAPIKDFFIIPFQILNTNTCPANILSIYYLPHKKKTHNVPLLQTIAHK